MNNYATSMHKYPKVNIAVVGGSGYTGLELLRLLTKHPAINKCDQFNSTDVKDLIASNYQVIFLATPAEVSAELASKMLQAGASVIDLSGAFRLSEDDSDKKYIDWYGMNHPSLNLLSTAHYGLVPWNTPDIRRPILISNPGCYATAILMALIPLLKLNLIDPDSIVIDAKSGTTGAGKKANINQLFSEVEGECLPYKIGEHQHLPEIKQYLKKFSGVKSDPFFVTSLLSTRRGIVAGLYARLNSGVTEFKIKETFNEFYSQYPYVKYSDQAKLKSVVGTPFTQITIKVVENKLYLFSCIDNLLKGAASQAIENFNLINHLPLTTGLEHLEALI